MRGQRARLNDRDGEVDENFWAQAAADQAAGRRADDEDPGVYLSLPSFPFILSEESGLSSSNKIS